MTTLDSERPRVAVVDDDSRIRALFNSELRDMGAEPLLCADGFELLELVQSQGVDLILLDLMMPGLDGLQCLQHLRQMEYPGTVLICTAFCDDAKREDALEAGAHDYILKPDLFDRLPQLLGRYLKLKSEGA